MAEIPQFRFAQPVTSAQQGMRFAGEEIRADQRMQLDKQRAEQEKKLKDFEIEMAKDKKKRIDEINRTDDMAKTLLGVLEAPKDQQQALFQQIYPTLDPELKDEWFPDGQWDPTKATTAVRSSLAVLDRLKMIHQKEAQAANLGHEKGMLEREYQLKGDLEKTKAKTKADKKGDSGKLKASESNALYSRAASLFGGMYNPVTGQFNGLSKDNAQQAMAIAERASELYQNGKAKNINNAASMAARELGIDIKELGKQPTKSQQSTTPAPANDPLGLR